MVRRQDIDPVAELSYLQMSQDKLDSKLLCWSLMFETRLLATVTDPAKLFSTTQRIQSFYKKQYTGAKAVCGYLESTDLDQYAYRPAILLHLTIDSIKNA